MWWLMMFFSLCLPAGAPDDSLLCVLTEVVGCFLLLFSFFTYVAAKLIKKFQGELYIHKASNHLSNDYFATGHKLGNWTYPY